MLRGSFDALAVPLPPSLQSAVETAVLELPKPAVVIQHSSQTAQDIFEVEGPGQRYGDETHEGDGRFEESHDDGSFDREELDGERWKRGLDDEQRSEVDDLTGYEEHAEDQPEDWSDDESAGPDITASYVPIDPCQPVIAAIRTAIGEHIPRFFIDLEVESYEGYTQQAADPYSLKRVSIERFAAAMLPHIERPTEEQRCRRIAKMAYQLRQLSIDYQNILLVCDIHDWPWIRESYFQPDPNPPADESTEDPVVFGVREKTLYFLFGELPFITGLYEQARLDLGDDSELSIDGVKRLLIAARESYQRKLGTSARKITPLLLRQCLQYIRNLTLMERRLTPDLFTILSAAKQIGGDTYAYHVLQLARRYEPRPPHVEPTLDEVAESLLSESVKMGVGQIELPTHSIIGAVNRFAGAPIQWRHLELRPQRKPKRERDKWMKRWNAGYQCSYPPEDIRIEQFRATVFQRAKQILGTDASRSEKFTTSVMDGIDIRETLRHWYDGDIYVRLNPPVRSGMDAVVMLFDTPADPRSYAWRTTWFAEHKEESTLAFFATNFMDNPIGPGICAATYGGAMFLYPPRPIEEIWRYPLFDYTTTLEERLIAAACYYSQQRHVALLSPVAPGYSWRRIAKLYGKRLVHVPLGQFSDSTLQQLRLVHVLNGVEVRSYASEFIQRP